MNIRRRSFVSIANRHGSYVIFLSDKCTHPIEPASRAPMCAIFKCDYSMNMYEARHGRAHSFGSRGLSKITKVRGGGTMISL